MGVEPPDPAAATEDPDGTLHPAGEVLLPPEPSVLARVRALAGYVVVAGVIGIDGAGCPQSTTVIRGDLML